MRSLHTHKSEFDQGPVPHMVAWKSYESLLRIKTHKIEPHRVRAGQSRPVDNLGRSPAFDEAELTWANLPP